MIVGSIVWNDYENWLDFEVVVGMVVVLIGLGWVGGMIGFCLIMRDI
jgi:cell division protein FtsX